MRDFAEIAFADHWIGIRIKIEGVPRVTTSVLAAILSRLEEAFAVIETSEAERLAKELECDQADIATLSEMVSHWRESLRGQMIAVLQAREGSLVIGGLVAAASLYIVEKTIGQTLQEAWKESRAHQKLKELLNRRLGVRANRLCAAVNGLGTILVNNVGAFRLSAEIERSDENQIFLSVVAKAESLVVVNTDSQVEAWRAEASEPPAAAIETAESDHAELLRRLFDDQDAEAGV